MPGQDQQITNQSQTQAGTTAGTSSTSQNQNQSTSGSTNPWAASQPLLTNLLASYGGQSTAVTPEQQHAIGTLQAGAAAAPNMGSSASDAVSKLFGSDTSPQVGMLSDALKQYQGNIGDTASGKELDPYSTPGFSDALKTMTSDITNQVKGVYAGSGRDPSGAGSFAGSLGRGLTQGLAPTIANQFNTNKSNQLNAANQLYGASGSTASGITGQEQVPLANAAQGIGLLPGVTSAYTAPGAAQLTAANLAQSTPFGNLAQLLGPAMGLAGLGQTTSGNVTGANTSTGTTAGTSNTTGAGTGTTTQPQSTMSNIIGGATAAASLASLFSDERMKEGIQPVGLLNDGQKIVKFRYKGMPQTHIGLLAQDVEKTMPDAVSEVGGLKMVDYDRATKKSAQMEAA